MGARIWLALALATGLAVAGCRESGSDALPPVGAAAVDAERAACAADGGAFSANGKGGFVCMRTPRDAGKACTKASDCSTACLARSKTCAPLDPLLGCQDILTEYGTRLTQCID